MLTMNLEFLLVLGEKYHHISFTSFSESTKLTTLSRHPTYFWSFFFRLPTSDKDVECYTFVTLEVYGIFFLILIFITVALFLLLLFRLYSQHV